MLRAQYSEHHKPGSVNSEVSKYIHKNNPEHSVEMEKTEVVAVEPKWFESEVKVHP